MNIQKELIQVQIYGENNKGNPIKLRKMIFKDFKKAMHYLENQRQNKNKGKWRKIIYTEWKE